MLLLADEKCRGEQWDILAEKFARDPPAGYQAEHPWRYIISVSSYGPVGPLAEWWYFNFVAPLTYKVGSPLRMVTNFEGSSGTVLEERQGSAPAQTRGAGGQNKRKAPGSGGSAPAFGGSSSWDKSMQTCNAWNQGGCQAKCSGGRQHLCSNCGGQHRRIECPQITGAAKTSNGGGGSSTKKNKKKKSGKGSGKGKPSA